MLSLLLQVSYYFSTFDGPVTAQRSILRAGAVWHPVDLAQPDHTAARGQPSTEPARASFGSAPGLACGSPPGDRWDATPRPPGLAATGLMASHPGDLPGCGAASARDWFYRTWCPARRRTQPAS